MMTDSKDIIGCFIIAKIASPRRLNGHVYTYIYIYIGVGWMKIFSADDESGESVNVSFLSSRYASADFSRGGLFKLQRDLDYPTEMADTLFG